MHQLFTRNRPGDLLCNYCATYVCTVTLPPDQTGCSVQRDLELEPMHCKRGSWAIIQTRHGGNPLAQTVCIIVTVSWGVPASFSSFNPRLLIHSHHFAHLLFQWLGSFQDSAELVSRFDLIKNLTISGLSGICPITEEERERSRNIQFFWVFFPPEVCYLCIKYFQYIPVVSLMYVQYRIK